MSRSKWLIGILAAALLMGGISFILLGSDPGPQKPEPIPAGDFSYAKALAGYRLERVMDQYHMPGMAAALIVDQEIVWLETKGWANLEEQIPVTAETIFKMWSLAKPLTALETMRLVEEGRLALDAPVTDYVPDLTLQSRFTDDESFTIRHLLTHHAGLPRNACVRPDWHYGPDALQKLVTALHNCYLAYPAGEQFKYSNVGMNILGYLIQDIRERPFPIYMEEALLKPLGMKDGRFWSTDIFGGEPVGRERLAVGYDYYQGEQHAYEPYDDPKIPSSNLNATVTDLAELVTFIFREGQNGGKQIIGPDNLQQMFDGQFPQAGHEQQMGLGWKIAEVLGGEKMVWHDGGPGEGTGSLVAFLPDRKLGVVLVANSTAFAGSVSAPLAVDLLGVMLETSYGVTAREDQVREKFEPDPAKMRSYTGDYAFMGQMIEIFLAGEQLKGRMDGLSFDLEPVAEDTFVLSHWLDNWGLTRFLNLPLDLSTTEITFLPAADGMKKRIMVNFGGIAAEAGTHYPEISAAAARWEPLAGSYKRYERLASGGIGEQRGAAEITLEDGRFFMSGGVGPILPLDDEMIIILSGPFAGETITWDKETGDLAHQGFIYTAAGANEAE